MGKQKLLSIVIPVYNNGRYIYQCLSSILQQDINFNDIEIVCINDGSTDNSLEEINRVEMDYDFEINIVNKENTGVSESRNVGIKSATGKFIWFIDSDDYIEKKSLKKIIDILENKNADIYIMGYNLVDDNGKKIKSIKEYNDNNRYDEILKNGRFNCVWQLIISKDFIIENDFKFNKQYIIAEDMLFNLDMISTKPKIYYIDTIVYNYRNNINGIMNSINIVKLEKKIENTIDAYYLYFDYIKKWDIDNEYNRTLVSIKFFNMLSSEVKNIIKLQKSKEYKIKKIDDILKNNKVIYAKSQMKEEKGLLLEARMLYKNKIKLYYIFRTLKDKVKNIIEKGKKHGKNRNINNK